MKTTALVLVLLVLPAPSFAQDDCPAGHVKHPALTALDHASMLAAYQASHKGIFGVESACTPGSGVHDCEYYISASNHYGVYGDDQCHAGWSGYWEAWLQYGRGDLTLVQTPARFQPAALPPAPIPVPPPVIDLSGVQAQLAAIAAELHEHVRADGDAHAAINQNISDGRTENRNFFQAVAAHWKSISAIAAPFVTYWTCHSTGKC